MNTQYVKDTVESFNLLSALIDDKKRYEYEEAINGKHPFRIVSKNIKRRYEFCIVRKKNNPWVSMTDYFKFNDHGYPIVKVMIDYDSNIIRVTTRVKPDLKIIKLGRFSNFTTVKMQIPKDRIEKYKKAGVEPKNIRLYSWSSNYYCFIEHYFKISKKNFVRLEKIINIFPNVLDYKKL